MNTFHTFIQNQFSYNTVTTWCHSNNANNLTKQLEFCKLLIYNHTNITAPYHTTKPSTAPWSLFQDTIRRGQQPVCYNSELTKNCKKLWYRYCGSVRCGNRENGSGSCSGRNGHNDRPERLHRTRHYFDVVALVVVCVRTLYGRGLSDGGGTGGCSHTVQSTLVVFTIQHVVCTAGAGWVVGVGPWHILILLATHENVIRVNIHVSIE